MKTLHGRRKKFHVEEKFCRIFHWIKNFYNFAALKIKGAMNLFKRDFESISICASGSSDARISHRASLPINRRPLAPSQTGKFFECS